MTGLAPTQTAKVLEWLQERGYPGKNMQTATVDKVVEDGPAAIGMDPEAFEALKLKRLSGFAALKKIPTMLNAACPEDDRVRGSLLWSGAERTHRWAGKIIQPQNFRRPTIAETEHLYRVLKSGNMDVEALELIYESPLEAIASCIRHFIEPEETEPGQFLDADYSAIEARIVLWLAGQEDGLQLFRDKKDPYVAMASKIFDVEVDDVTKDQRFVGKQSVLGCGYGMGAEKFRGTALQFGRELSQSLSEKAVKTFREVNYKVVALWRSMEAAAKEAFNNPGKIVEANDKVRFCATRKPGFPALIMQLPSGHNLIYPHPKLVPVWFVFHAGKLEKFNTPKSAQIFQRKLAKVIEEKNKDLPADKQKTAPEVREDRELTFIGKRLSKWQRIGTYGGSLVENAVQAIAGDLMTEGALEAERQGFKIFMLVHDQALAEWEPGQDPEDFCRALCTLPDWAEGLPLEAEGGFVPFYKKD
jgi:DNA polymerase